MKTYFPSSLRKLRVKHGLTQEYLAEELGVSRQAVGSWESGHAEPNICTIVKIRGILKCSFNELLEAESSAFNTEYKNRTIERFYNPDCIAIDFNTCEEIHKEPSGVLYIIHKNGEKYKIIPHLLLISRLKECGEYQGKSYEVYEQTKEFNY